MSVLYCASAAACKCSVAGVAMPCMYLRKVSPCHAATCAVGYQMASLAKYEEVLQAKVGRYTTDGHSASHRGADCQALAMCQAKQSMAWKTLALKCAANLVRTAAKQTGITIGCLHSFRLCTRQHAVPPMLLQVTLQDYCLLMPEDVRAMEEREAALQHMFQIEDELATKRHQLEQLQHASAESNKVGWGAGCGV